MGFEINLGFVTTGAKIEMSSERVLNCLRRALRSQSRVAIKC